MVGLYVTGKKPERFTNSEHGNGLGEKRITLTYVGRLEVLGSGCCRFSERGESTHTEHGSEDESGVEYKWTDD